MVERKCSKLDRDVLALPVRLGGLGLSNPCHAAAHEHASSLQVTSPLVEHIVAQTHQLPNESLIESGRLAVKRGRAEELSGTAENLKQIVPRKTKRALDLVQEKGSSVWLTVRPIQERHNKLRDLEADLLSMVCSDVEVEPVLQDITEEQLSRGSNRTQDARLDIRVRGFWDPQSSAFFDVRVCHPNAESYKDQEPQQIYPIHENDKKRLYSRRVLDVEHGAFTPLKFTTTGGMGKECIRYPSRLAQLIAAKKGEQYSQTISWIREGNPLRSFSRPWFAFEDRG
ncbi:uncharacterized protein LOC122961935 [Acropora millepora]|uniref:uncharacterized protein LOC122961935 n=1 Tax=Acropora millepora TaxID=45264 RepID=UPI001CF32B3D|nr:uncharacterized protein LOC122961935 [Acropora millepora]